MPANRNALIRYKTIDTCLRNRYRRWTLEDLIDACSDALYEFEGIRKGISKRTIQLDIQQMRSEKLGYNAPIIVVDNKYYTYEDPEYSITNTPLSQQDLKVMSEAVEILRQFKGFGYFNEMNDIVSRLEDHVTSVKQHTIPVIDFEKNENLKGLNHLDDIYRAIINKWCMQIKYYSFKARSPHMIAFSPYLLKEYRNRWFVFGYNHRARMIMNLALDRIVNINLNEGRFTENTFFDPSTFFKDIVGVTKNIGSKAEKIRFKAERDHAPYILTKPIHASQVLIENCKDKSMIFEIEVVVNHELHKELLSFAGNIKVISPPRLVEIMKRKLREAADAYDSEDVPTEDSNEK